MNWMQQLLILLSLVLAGAFGYFYNRLVEWINNRWPDNDNTSDLVVVGVAGVLLALIHLGLWNVAYLFALFGAAGLPMAVGYKLQNEGRRKVDAELRALSAEILKGSADDNAKKSL